MAAGCREAVFSSTGFRIRATEGRGRGAFTGWAEQTAASLFFTLFPADCRICASPLIEISRLPVCSACLEAMRPLSGSLCSVCGEALFSPAFLDQGEAVCGLCQQEKPIFERAAAYGSYSGGLRDLIHLLKYQQVRPAANVLGRMLTEAIAVLDKQMPSGRILVVPVPLHPRKQVQRGFNQSELIAAAALRQLARRERFEMAGAVLIRKRETGSQIGLTHHQRIENVRGAFGVSDPASVTGRCVLLVDDVFTTGTTVSECARALRRAGALQVWVATVARTLKVAAVSAEREEEEDGDRLTMAAHS